MEHTTAFQNAEIKAIKTRDEYYHASSYVLGVLPTTNLFAAILRSNTKDVILIPYHSIVALEVEYEHEQATVQDTPGA
jgi:hypothetical protein